MTAFCPSGQGSNPGGAPGLNLGFFCFRCRQSILAGHRAFFLSIKLDLSIKVTSLFFPISFHQQCLCNIALSIVTQMRKINPKRDREWPIFKKKVFPGWSFCSYSVQRLRRLINCAPRNLSYLILMPNMYPGVSIHDALTILVTYTNHLST